MFLLSVNSDDDMKEILHFSPCALIIFIPLLTYQTVHDTHYFH